MGAGLKRARAAARATREPTVEQRVQKSIDEVLGTNEWPIFKMQDDRGLEESEYFEFVMTVVRKAKLR